MSGAFESNIFEGHSKGFYGLGQNPYRLDPTLQRRPEGGIFASDTFRGHAFSGMGKSPPQEPKWLPWLLVGGAVLVGGGIIWTAYQSRR